MTQREKKKKSSSSKKFFKGVKSFLLLSSNNKSSQQQQQKEDNVYTKEGVAVTLTTEFNHKNNINQAITLLNANLDFMPCQAMSSSCFETKAFVHYEPKKAQVVIGTNPDTKHRRTIKSLRITVEQYAWLIQQLQEENNVFQLVGNSNYSPMLGITSNAATISIGKKLIRFFAIQQEKQEPLQCIFMLPKALLLQAASYIPMTKPLPPPFIPIQFQFLNNLPFISEKYQEKLKRYCECVKLCNHELFTVVKQQAEEPSPPSSLIDENSSTISVAIITDKIQCADCSIKTNLSTIIQPQVLLSHPSVSVNKIIQISVPQQQQSIMFPISFIQQRYTLMIPQEKKVLFTTSSAIQPSRRVAFDSIARRQKPHAVSAFQYIPPDKTMSSSSISSISQYSHIEDIEEEEDSDNEEDMTPPPPPPQRYGYVAVNDENKEILVVFPGMNNNMSHNVFENNTSLLAPVPWLEIETPSYIETPEDVLPWVLDCALTAWHRCEIKVVTLLMRLCSVLPTDYKVVIIGYSLGGAVASLCASSLRTTKLLMNRSITVCAIHSPRVGNKTFLSSLSNQNVDTIRITHYKDSMAHLPPRTSGLLHIGDSTIILPTTAGDGCEGYVLDNMSPNQMEDMLDKTFSFKHYNLDSHSMVWDINLSDGGDNTTCNK